MECWAFTSCKREKGYVSEAPTIKLTPAPVDILIPGPNGAQVPVFGGIDYDLFKPTLSPAPSSSPAPSLTPTLPSLVVSKLTMASYYCGMYSYAFIHSLFRNDLIRLIFLARTI